MSAEVFVAALVLVVASSAASEPLPHRTFQCAGYCKGNGKFQYEAGTTYVYRYNADTFTGIQGAGKEESRLHMSATASFHVASTCNLILKLDNVALEDSKPNNAQSRSKVTQSEEFAEALERNVLHFSFQDGEVSELCSASNEPAWVLNIKRGILSAFQNTMKSLYTPYLHHETDVTGTCDTKYMVMLPENDTSSLLVRKEKNMLACSHRTNNFLSLHTTPYHSAAKSQPLIRSTHVCEQVISPGRLLERAQCLETHIFNPFSNVKSGAVTRIEQSLVYTNSHKLSPPVAQGRSLRRTTLLYEYIKDDKPSAEESEFFALQMLEQMADQITQGVQKATPSMFSQLVAALRRLDQENLNSLFHRPMNAHMRKFLLDAMNVVGTADGMAAMTALFQEKKITSIEMDEWLTSVAFLKEPTAAMLTALLPLLDGVPEEKALLGISSLVHSFCQLDSECSEKEPVHEVSHKLASLLGTSCRTNNRTHEKVVILALKAIGNAGVYTGRPGTLRQCYQSRFNSMDVKLAAISAYRRLPCSKETTTYHLNAYMDKNLDPELRIASYLAVMQCPSTQALRHIKETLYSEDVNQVASFVWTHLTNLQETASPWKQNIRDLVSNSLLRNKFKTDARKFSRNYEASFFSDRLDVGAAVESNVVFTPQSYLPRSGSFNLTVDLFGQSVNILELGARAEGFESLMERAFGPNGYFPDNMVSKVVKNLKDNGEVLSDSQEEIQNSINHLSEQFDAKSRFRKEPEASVYARIFGNELMYSQYHGLNEIIGDIDTEDSVFDIVQKLIKEEAYDYTKTMLLIDTHYAIPTIAGLPLELTVNGTAAISLQMHGSMNVKQFLRSGSVYVEGNISPSAVLQFAGTMSVGVEEAAQAGMQVVSSLHTNTHLDGRVLIEGKEVVDIQINMPQKRIEVLDVSSHVFLLHREQMVESAGLKENTEKYQACGFPKIVSTVTGIQPCIELSYVNASLRSDAPYFPLTGPFVFRLGVDKVDTFTAYEFLFKRKYDRKGETFSTILQFDTPGSKVNRRLRAHYEIDHANSAVHAAVMTPFGSIGMNGKLESSPEEQSINAVVTYNNQELLLAHSGYKIAKKGNAGRFEPFFSMNFKQKRVVEITGKINYVDSSKYSADILIKTSSNKESMLISGDLLLDDKGKYELNGNLKLGSLHSTLHSSLYLTENYVASKALVQYTLPNQQTESLDFSCKLQNVVKAMLTHKNAILTLQMTQFPQYNLDLSLEMQHSKQYFENNGKLTIGNTMWQTQQMYRFLSTKTDTDFGILFFISCPKLQIEYGVDLQHKATSTGISSHIEAKITPQITILKRLKYEQKLHETIFELEGKSPWYEAGVNTKLLQVDTGQHKADAEIFWGIPNKKSDTVKMKHINASGLYTHSNDGVQMSHTVDLSFSGNLNGQLNMGISSSRQQSTKWVHLDVSNKTYLVMVTYIKDIFHYVDVGVQLAEMKYSGSFALLNTPTENALAIDLKLHKRLTMETKVTCDRERQAFEFELYWDRDSNPDKKITLVAQVKGATKEVLLEIPGQHIRGEVLSLSTGITGMLQWGEDYKIDMFLEWNMGSNKADITAKLTTPFAGLKSQSLQVVYDLLDDELTLLVQAQWQKKVATLNVNAKRVNTLSILQNFIIQAQVHSTVRALNGTSFALQHSFSGHKEGMSLDTNAYLNFNNKKATFSATWKNNKSTSEGDISFYSPFHKVKNYQLTIRTLNNALETSANAQIKWGKENEISSKLSLKKGEDMAGSIEITTPFEGYELTSGYYNFTKSSDMEGHDRLTMKFGGAFKQYFTLFDFSGSKNDTLIGGIAEIKMPFTEKLILRIAHSLKIDEPNERLLVSFADRQIVHFYLEGNVKSFTGMYLTSGLQLFNHTVKGAVTNLLLPGTIETGIKGMWNNQSLSASFSGSYETGYRMMSLYFEASVKGSVLPQDFGFIFDHIYRDEIYHSNLYLPGGIIIINHLIFNKDNWENQLSLLSPKRNITIENFHTIKDGSILEHNMVIHHNNQQSSGVLTVFMNPDTTRLQKATLLLLSPWTDPVTAEITLQADISVLRPTFILRFNKNKEIKAECELEYQKLKSRFYFKIFSPFHNPILIDAAYDISTSNLLGRASLQWQERKWLASAEAQLDEKVGSVLGEVIMKEAEAEKNLISGKFGYSFMRDTKEVYANIVVGDKQGGFDLSLSSEEEIHKASLSIMTPFRNWENLSVSGQLNMAQVTKMAVLTLSKNLEDITISGSLSIQGASSKFSAGLTTPFAGYHNVNIYGHLEVPKRNVYSLDVVFEKGSNKTECTAKLKLEKYSSTLEMKLKSPYRELQTLNLQFSYDISNLNKVVNLNLAVNNLKFTVDSSCSFGNGVGKGYMKLALPFEKLQTLSFSLEQDFNPSTNETTASVIIAKNEVVAQLAGSLILQEDGSLKSHIEIKTPVLGYKTLKCDISITTPEKWQQILSVNFFKENQSFAIRGVWESQNEYNTEINFEINTPIKGLEAINSRVGYQITEKNLNDPIFNVKVFSSLEINEKINSFDMELYLSKRNSIFSLSSTIPLLRIPTLDIKWYYDLNSDPPVVTFQISKNNALISSIYLKIQNNSLSGEIKTPFERFGYIVLSGSLEAQGEEQFLLLRANVNEHSFQLICSSKLALMNSEIRAEFITTIPQLEKMFLHGKYNFLYEKKVALLSVNANDNMTYEVSVSGNINRLSGSFEIRTETTIIALESIYVIGSYNFVNDYSINLQVVRNGVKNNYASTIAFKEDGTLIQIETPYKEARAISLYSTYQSNTIDSSGFLKVLQNGDTTLLNASFTSKNGIFDLKLQSPLQIIKEIALIVNLTSISSDKGSAAISFLRNKQVVLDMHSQFSIDWTRKLEAVVELNCSLFSKDYQQLMFTFNLNKMQPNPGIHLKLSGNDISLLDLNGSIAFKHSFKLNFNITSIIEGYENQIVTFEISREETFIKMYANLTRNGKEEKYALRISREKQDNSLTIEIRTPMKQFELFSLKWQHNQGFIMAEIITPFPGYENHTLTLHIESEAATHVLITFFLRRNSDAVGFNTTFVHEGNMLKMQFYAITPFASYNKFEFLGWYDKQQLKNVISLNLRANDVNLKLEIEEMSKTLLYESTLHITSTLKNYEKISAHLVLDQRDSNSVKGSIEMPSFGADITGFVSHNFLQGQLLVSISTNQLSNSYSALWNLKITPERKEIELNVLPEWEMYRTSINAVINTRSIKDFDASLSYIVPFDPANYRFHFLFNIEQFNKSKIHILFISDKKETFNFLVELQLNSPEKNININISNIGYFQYIVHYDGSIGLRTGAFIYGSELSGALSYNFNRAKSEIKFAPFPSAHMHLSLSYDISTFHKLLDIKYQQSHREYSFNANLTLQNSVLPAVIITIRTPLKNFTMLQASTDYVFTPTHKGFKIFYQKEHQIGEISLSLWKEDHALGVRFNLSLPEEAVGDWNGIAYLEYSSGILVHANFTWSTINILTSVFELTSLSASANISTPFREWEHIALHFSVKKQNGDSTVHAFVIWGERKMELLGTVALNAKSKDDLLAKVSFISPWTDDAAITAMYGNKDASEVKIMLYKANQIKEYTAKLRYFIKDSDIDVYFLLELDSHKTEVKATYKRNAQTHLEVHVFGLNIVAVGNIDQGKSHGKILIKSPFKNFNDISAIWDIDSEDSMYFISGKWNDKVLLINGKEVEDSGFYSNKFTIVCPTFFETSSVGIKYNSDSAEIELDIPKILYLNISSTFKQPLYSAKVNFSSPVLKSLEHLTIETALNMNLFHVSLEAEIWTLNKQISLETLIQPRNYFFIANTTFESFQNIRLVGVNKQDTLAFVGSLVLGKEIASEFDITLTRPARNQYKHSVSLIVNKSKAFGYALTLDFNSPTNFTGFISVSFKRNEALMEIVVTKTILSVKAMSSITEAVIGCQGFINYSSWQDIRFSGQVTQNSEGQEINGSIKFSNNAFDIVLSNYKPADDFTSTITLGGSYLFTKPSQLDCNFYINDYNISLFYKYDQSLFNVTTKLNMWSEYSFSVVHTTEPGTYMLFYYTVDRVPGLKITFARTENAIHINSDIDILPFIPRGTHNIYIHYSLEAPNYWTSLAYEGKTVHSVFLSFYFNNVFNVTAKGDSSVLGKWDMEVILQKSWKAGSFKLNKLFAAGFESEKGNGQGTIFIDVRETHHEANYDARYENGLKAKLNIKSPLFQQNEVNLTADIITTKEGSLTIDLKCIGHQFIHNALLELNAGDGNKTMKILVLTNSKPYLSLNASMAFSSYMVQAKISLHHLGVDSSAVLWHKLSFPFDSELHVISPYIPSKIVRAILNTENDTVLLYAGLGNTILRRYILLEGSLDRSKRTVHMNFNAPFLSSVQHIGVSGIFQSDKMNYSAGLRFQFSSESVNMTALTARFLLSREGLDINGKFIAPWDIDENYEIEVLIPFVLSNTMKPQMSLVFGKEYIYSLYVLFVNQNNIKEAGFGASYGIKKLEALLKYESSGIPGLRLTLDVPQADTVSHYGLDIRFQRGQTIMGIKSIVNYTLIGVEWDNKRTELKYSLSFDDSELEGMLSDDNALQCAFHLQLTTPLKNYEESGLKIYVGLSPSHNLIIATLKYPGESKPIGFEFNYHFSGLRAMSLVSQVHIPFITSLQHVALIFNSKFGVEQGDYTIVLGGHWNDNELSIALNSDIGETIALKAEAKLQIQKETFKVEANYNGSHQKAVTPFMANVIISSPYAQFRNAELSMEFDVTKSIGANVKHNSKDLYGFHVYTNNNTAFVIDLNNPWRSLHVVFGYDISEDIMIKMEVSWNTKNIQSSQLGLVLAVKDGPLNRKEIIAIAKLPTRVVSFNMTRHFSSKLFEYSVNFSWKQNQIVGFRTFVNMNSTYKNIALISSVQLNLPSRSFELIGKATAVKNGTSIESAGMGVEFLWHALHDRAKMVGIELKRHSKTLEMILKYPTFPQDIIVRIEKQGKLSYSHLPFSMRVELEYSPLIEEKIVSELMIQQPENSTLGLELNFLLQHPATLTDLQAGIEVAHKSKYSSVKFSAKALNSISNQKKWIEIKTKMSHVQPKIEMSLKTLGNKLEAQISTFGDSSSTQQGVIFELSANQKEPMRIKAQLNRATSTAEIEASYGQNRKHALYAGIPQSNEITFGAKHTLFDTEYEDGVVLLRLNTSRLLWSRIKWRARAVNEIRQEFMHEYEDVYHITKGIIDNFSDALLDDIAFKLTTLYPSFNNSINTMVSHCRAEVEDVYKDLQRLRKQFTEMYEKNEFYMKDIEPYISKTMFFMQEKASGICYLIFHGFESLISPIKDLFNLLMDYFYVDVQKILYAIDGLQEVVFKLISGIMKAAKDVKQQYINLKLYLKRTIENARTVLENLEHDIKQCFIDIKLYLISIVQAKIQSLESYLIAAKDTIKFFNKRIADLEDKINEFMLEMLNNMVGSEELQHLIDLYNSYISWLEELHFQDYVERTIELLQSLGKIFMQDIYKIFSEYKDQLDNLSKSVNEIYSNLDAMPIIAYLRHTALNIYYKVQWAWKQYEVEEWIQNQAYYIIQYIDRLLLQVLSTIEMDAPTRGLAPSVVMRPDLGLIEYSQNLPVQWHGFNELPQFHEFHLFEQSNEIPETIDKYGYHLMDTFHDYMHTLHNLSMKSVLPPFYTHGLIAGKHFITFDKKYYTFDGECTYVAASDFLNNKFSVLVNYDNKYGITIKKSLSIMIEDNMIEIFSGNRGVTINGRKVELPVKPANSAVLKQDGAKVILHTDFGLKIECNMHYDICSVHLTGWYFGKTAGLLGTFDYEPRNDFSLPNGTITTDISTFTESWRVTTSSCHSNNELLLKTILPESNQEENICKTYLKLPSSPLRSCFSHVDKMPFYEMCKAELSQQGDGCLALAAYVAECRSVGVDIFSPHECVQCVTEGSEIVTPDVATVYDGVETKLADVVFVVEQASCMKSVNLAELTAKLDSAMGRKGLQARYSLIGFNGLIYNEPHTYTSDGKIWTTKRGIDKALHRFQSSISETSMKRESTFKALLYASGLQFRATASKTIVLIQCTPCQETEDKYGDMITVLLENDITLHMLQPRTLKLRSGRGKMSKVYGVDLNGAFTGRNLKTLLPSKALLRQVTLPKDLCTPLALESNGTLFNMDRLLTQQQNSIKKFIDVWARRISQTAEPSQCQKCECVADEDQVGRLLCSRCLSPSTQQFLKEWESMKSGNHAAVPNELLDYADYPA